jgi:hypothetical protein
MSFDGYGWYLSSTAALLYLSWIVHNLVAWLKIKPFLTARASTIFLGTLSLTVAPILFQIVNNFLFFNNIRDLYTKVRPYEVLLRFVNAITIRSIILKESVETHGGFLPVSFSFMSSRLVTRCQ